MEGVAGKMSGLPTHPKGIEGTASRERMDSQVWKKPPAASICSETVFIPNGELRMENQFR
jgi:hypothetical protein